MNRRLLAGLLVTGLLASCQKEERVVEENLVLVGYDLTASGFHKAAGAGDTEAMAILVERGVAPDARACGESALHVAARQGRVDALRALLAWEVPLEGLGNGGRTPLMVAVESNKIEAVRFLLEQGADPERRDDLGYRSLTLAAEKGHADLLRVLVAHAHENYDEALFLASLRGHGPAVEILLRKGASVYARINNDMTALMMAAREGHDEVVEMLLDYGANRFAVNGEGQTAGEIAMASGRLEVGALLLAEPDKEEFFLEEPPVLAEAGMVEFNVADEEEIPGAIAPPPEPTASPTGEVALTVALTEAVPAEPPRERLAPAEAGSSAAPVVMTAYRERTLPIRVEAVAGEVAQIRFLFGEQERVSVKEGEEIPFSGLKVVSVQEHRQRTKESGNAFADVSTVLVEDPRSGERRELVTSLPASAHDPFAMVRSRDGRDQVARRGGLVRSASGELFRVLDVRPTQVVLECLPSGSVTTIRLGGRR